MFIGELFEAANKKIVVIYPGRFQPFHKGHAAVYNHLCKVWGNQNVYIVTSNKVEPPKSPFSFMEKKKMMIATGINPEKIIFDAQPYQAKGFVDLFDPKTTILLFAVSEKDMAEDPRFKFGVKKDGSPSYFQPFESVSQCKTLDQHAYMTTVPTFDFKVLGKPANSASQIRTQFADADEATQKKIVTDLFGKFDPTIFEIMKSKLSPISENINESVGDDTQIHKIQQKYDVPWNEAARMYHVDKVRVEDAQKIPDNDLLNPDPKIRSLAKQVIVMKKELNDITGNTSVA